MVGTLFFGNSAGSSFLPIRFLLRLNYGSNSRNRNEDTRRRNRGSRINITDRSLRPRPYFQRPRYRFPFLPRYTVLADPLAFNEITGSTFLFAPHLEVDVFARALGGIRMPRLCVGTDLNECLDRLHVRGRERGNDRQGKDESFQRYLDATASRPLPDFERDDWMYFTHVYWIKPDNDEQNTHD